MPAMLKKLLVRSSLLIIVAIAGFLLLVWWTAPTNIASIEHFKSIRGQMTEAEVTELLGPGNDGSILESPNRKLANLEAVDWGVPPGPTTWKEWRTPEGRRLAVAFANDGKVKATASFDVEDAWLDKIRRLLRL
jgi:hypothetical protein